ncbi:lysine N(6)-hydroxylase/L-ornithine N(5)-oxygenase family protein [Methylobacterium sp. J-068]|uniref:lysine N(6)-hydroxylase/L-ornithine N(5)-oxygenase family protein n=1 Tax=Methylobacterium sp. J-068 TaxID=2836649 RepID=UPI001FB8EA39|nr:lysine N(6)-hydroxylase/L-ornithine N(5)-oxygenase family protein [Methylobacterium sp. J-068]MCJ2036198.1 lysine N(6)-hydroxylase/L-ornithine N(5)-oxygenase family protein [Methylobacterium sp. J-068]
MTPGNAPPRDLPPYDLLGVGFGPSNLALAIALDERARRTGAGFRYRFLERQAGFTWHGGMLLPGSDMQICFLKDLVTLRDPTSPLTFVNYLHGQGRLQDFINLRTFYPSRVEFNDYLRWVADRFADRCAYGETVLAVEPEPAVDGRVEVLRVSTRDASGDIVERRTRNLVVAAGGTAHVPEVFGQAARDGRVFHSSAYLDRVSTDRAALGLDAEGARVAVVGGGQSAAEISHDLHARFPRLCIDLVFRGHALKPSDSSPFVNEIFNPAYTDFVYAQPEERRDAIVRTFRNTNYAVVDADLLAALYAILYQQKIGGLERLRLRPRHEIVGVASARDGIVLATHDRFSATDAVGTYACVILATGYDRSAHAPFLDPIAAYRTGDTVERDYKAPTVPGFAPGIYLQGYSEFSHGLSDTLLSVVATRSQDIVDSLFRNADARSRGLTSMSHGVSL